MFAVGFKHSYYPHQWSLKGVRDAHPAFPCTHALKTAFWAGKPGSQRILTEAAFKVLRL
ncbi:hypothetical protein AWT69_003184 [Pseudomonas putida]|nr:hypothetical protein AWT69_003184 [Pseudomonas putida]